MKLKKFIDDVVRLIPHLSILSEKRTSYRYEPCGDLVIELKNGDSRVDARILDISIGGMRIETGGSRIYGAESILLVVDDLRLDLPCKKIRKTDNQYHIEFANLDSKRLSGLEYLISKYTKTPPFSGGSDEIFR